MTEMLDSVGYRGRVASLPALQRALLSWDGLNDTAGDAVLSLFHILNQFDIPKGSVQSSAVGGTVDEITEWTSVADLKNLRWYFRTFADQSIRMVDLKEAVAAAKGEMRTIEMEGTTQTIGNASTSFVAGK